MVQIFERNIGWLNSRAGLSAASSTVRIVIINGLGTGAVGGSSNPSLSPSTATAAVPSSFDSASVLLSLGRGDYLPTQSQASYRSASSGPSARRPSSCFDVDNKEANVRANIDVADGHADIREWVMARAVLGKLLGWCVPTVRVALLACL